MSRATLLDLLGFLLGLAMLGLGVTALRDDASAGDHVRLGLAVIVTLLFTRRLRRALSKDR